MTNSDQSKEEKLLIELASLKEKIKLLESHQSDLFRSQDILSQDRNRIEFLPMQVLKHCFS